ncbi:hypothetical protein ENSA5_12330 [Enhygromyxa salina]|uniref:Lipoprotein n=1 Tax=Enhygromyxa salina TaxID=215803 RepID=A0A2S9YFH9_9BACT|nr:hypothetical protein [Enhygromyxa salina]PRQ03864.1 hypothetical protein ENSA5_12330 [Enhygromyxa salina]
MKRLSTILAGLGALTLVGSGCAGLGSPTSSTAHLIDLDQPQLRQFAVASTTDFERDVRLETGERKKLTPALFGVGVVAGTIGAVGGVAFGVAGFVTRNQLNNGYGVDGLDLDERDRLVSRGEAFNTAALSLTALAVVGYALALVTYGVDWNRCGPLAPKKRHCATN